MLGGRTVNFKNTVIIMTSNVGAKLIAEKKQLGFGTSEIGAEKEYEDTKKDVLTELKKQFKPEFLNRIDEIIVFHKLTPDEIDQIVEIMLQEVATRLMEQDMEIIFDKTAKELIAKKGTDITYGARPLRRAIQSLVEDRLAEEMLDGKLKAKDRITLFAENEKIEVRK